MRAALTVALAAILLLPSACESRAPLTPGEVNGIADHLQLRENLSWGEATETLAAAPSPVDGRRWWQVRYHDAPDGAARVILVDDDSGWARLPMPGYALRLTPLAKPAQSAPVVAAEGGFVLALTPAESVDEERRTALEREVVRLNALSGGNGLVPLFSLRRGRDGQVSIVYGWQGNQGIAKDGRVVEWITARTPYHAPRWVDLAAP
jgi:hypothetical protein